MNDLFSSIWQWIAGAASNVYDVIASFYHFGWYTMLSPAPSLIGNIFIIGFVFVVGWYIAAMAGATWTIKHSSGEEVRVSRCSRQANLRWETCFTNHPSNCWSERTFRRDMTSEQRREAVLHAMTAACLWWIAPAAIFIMLPWAIVLAPVAVLSYGIWLALLIPFFKGSQLIGTGIVNTTTLMATVTVKSIETRAMELNQHKALNAAPSEEDSTDEEDEEVLKPEPIYNAPLMDHP